jgi:hypothetical protein
MPGPGWTRPTVPWAATPDRNQPLADVLSGGYIPGFFHPLTEAESASTRPQTLSAANMARLAANRALATPGKRNRLSPRHSPIGIPDYRATQPTAIGARDPIGSAHCGCSIEEVGQTQLFDKTDNVHGQGESDDVSLLLVSASAKHRTAFTSPPSIVWDDLCGKGPAAPKTPGILDPRRDCPLGRRDGDLAFSQEGLSRRVGEGLNPILNPTCGYRRIDSKRLYVVKSNHFVD